MRAKVTLTKTFGIKTSTKSSLAPDSKTRVMKENKAVVQEIWKTSIFDPKASKEVYHHIKFRKSVMNRRCSNKNFLIFKGRHQCWNLFFDKNAGLLACNFIKKRLQHRCFLANIHKFLRTPVLKNICERLLLRVFLNVFLHEQIT